MREDCVVYGLGEMPRGLNKRGWHYIANNTDESHHTEDKLSYYGAHNFLLIRNGEDCFGLFVDFPGKVHYDIGYTRHDTLCFHTEEPDYELYVLSGGDENALCKEFRASSGAATSRRSGRSVWRRAAGATRPKKMCGRSPANTRQTACRWI